MDEKINCLRRLVIEFWSGNFSTNINGIHEKANVNITITKLISPNKLFRDRYWQQPDQFVLSIDEYYTLFPYDLYKNETQKSSWELGEKVIDITDSTSENSN